MSRMLGGFVTRANVEKAREDSGGVNNVVVGSKKRVNQRHEQCGGLVGQRGRVDERGRRERRLSFVPRITRVHVAALIMRRSGEFSDGYQRHEY